MSFEALRADLEALNKALPQGAPVASAAGAEGEGEGNEGAPGADQGDGDDGGELLGKSFTFQLADGTEVEALDGADLVKSFGNRLVASEAAAAKTNAEVLGVLTAQTALLKSMGEKLAALGGAPAGRRSVLSVRESVPASNTVQPMAKSLGNVTNQQVLDMAAAAWKADRITSTELAGAYSLGLTIAALPAASA